MLYWFHLVFSILEQTLHGQVERTGFDPFAQLSKRQPRRAPSAPDVGTVAPAIKWDDRPFHEQESHFEEREEASDRGDEDCKDCDIRPLILAFASALGGIVTPICLTVLS